MDSDHFYDSLFFCSRDDLESLQLVRKSVSKTIAARSNVLSLRSIHRVDGVDRWNPLDKIQIFVEDDSNDAHSVPDYVTPFRYGDYAGTIRRLQNSCIKHFYVGIQASLFLWYWRREAADVTIVSIVFEPPETTDYGVLDSIVNLLRPKTIDVSGENGPSPFFPWDQRPGYVCEYLELLARDSFLNTLQVAPVNVWRGVFPPPSFILKEPGYSTYELRIHDSIVADGIDAFIKSFFRDGCTNEKLESVIISWNVQRNGRWPFGPSLIPQLPGNPTTTDKPLPEAEIAWLGPIGDSQRVSQCEMHHVVDEQLLKRMDIYKWSVDYARSTTHIIQCLVKNA